MKISLFKLSGVAHSYIPAAQQPLTVLLRLRSLRSWLGQPRENLFPSQLSPTSVSPPPTLSYICLTYIHLTFTHTRTHTSLSLSHTCLFHISSHTYKSCYYIYISPLLFHTHKHTHICSGGKISPLISAFKADWLIASFCTGSSYESYTALCCCGFLLIKLKITP